MHLCTKTCKNVHLKYSFMKKNVQKRAKTCKNVHLKGFRTQFKNVHLQGPCSLRPCISRPYCRAKNSWGSLKFLNSKPVHLIMKIYLYNNNRLKLGLSQRHTKFEKIFFMVLTNQLINLVNVKTTRKIFSNYECFSKSPNFNF